MPLEMPHTLVLRIGAATPHTILKLFSYNQEVGHSQYKGPVIQSNRITTLRYGYTVSTDLLLNFERGETSVEQTPSRCYIA